MMRNKLTIAIADHSLIVRSGLLSVLRHLGGINIDAYEITDAPQLKVKLIKLKPDVLIINPLMLGTMTAHQLKTETNCDKMRCVALVTSLLDTSLLTDFMDEISIYNSPEQIKNKLIKLGEFETEVKHDISSREKEVIVCVVKGMTNKQIAENLNLSVHTVVTHRKNIAAKLNIHSASGLTIYAIVNNMVDLQDVKNIIYSEE